MSNEVVKETSPVSGKRKLGLWIGLGVVAVLIIGLISAPMIAEGFIKNNMEKFLGIEGVQAVELQASGLQLVGGKFDGLNIEGENLKFGQLNVAEYSFVAAEGQVDVIKLISQKEIIVKNNQLIDVTMHVKPEDFQVLLEKYYPSLKDMELTFGDGLLQISGVANTTVGVNVPLTMTATIQSEDWSSLQIYAQQIDLEQKVSEQVKQELAEIFNVRIPFDQARLPIYIDQVDVTPGELTIRANSTFAPQD